jgi:hypothetical protein
VNRESAAGGFGNIAAMAAIESKSVDKVSVI